MYGSRGQDQQASSVYGSRGQPDMAGSVYGTRRGTSAVNVVLVGVRVLPVARVGSPGEVVSPPRSGVKAEVSSPHMA